MMRKIKIEHTNIKSVYTLALGNKAHLLEELSCRPDVGSHKMAGDNSEKNWPWLPHYALWHAHERLSHTLC